MAFVRNKNLLESGNFAPSSIPKPIAMTFLIAPQIGNPMVSLMYWILTISLSIYFFTFSLIVLCFVARVSPKTFLFFMSIAKLPPEMIPIGAFSSIDKMISDAN